MGIGWNSGKNTIKDMGMSGDKVGMPHRFCDFHHPTPMTVITNPYAYIFVTIFTNIYAYVYIT
jgi:hypothetical protein